MGKYIDSEKLIAEIERRLKDYWEICFHDVKAYNEDSNVRELKELLILIDSLQQEQPKVNLEKEICEYFEGWRINYYSETEELLKNNGCTVDIDDVKEIARHFCHLGCRHTEDTQTINGWVARNIQGFLKAYGSEIFTSGGIILPESFDEEYGHLGFGDEPIEVEITISTLGKNAK